MASGLLHPRKTIWRHRRRAVYQTGAAPHPAEDKQVEKVHRAQNDQHHANLNRQGFDGLLRYREAVDQLESQTHITEIAQIENDEQQMIEGTGQRFITVN